MPRYEHCECPSCEGCIEVATPEELDAARQIAWCEPTQVPYPDGFVGMLKRKTQDLWSHMNLAPLGCNFDRVVTCPLSSYYHSKGDMEGYYAAFLKWSTEDLPLFGGPLVDMHPTTLHGVPIEWDHQEVAGSITIKR